MDTNATGRFITELRKELGCTQRELAERLGVTDKAISRWETGKGLPDTALLKPLSDILGVSVGELLSGKRIEENQKIDQADKVIVEALDYSRQMLIIAANVMLYIAAVGMLLSPLFMVGESQLWVFGIFSLALAGFFSLKKYISDKLCYFLSLGLQAVALVLEILPVGAVMIFAAGPEERITEVYSYFSLIPLGYANFAPVITGLLTVACLLLGGSSLIFKRKVIKARNAAFLCSVIAIPISLLPLLVFGPSGMNGAGYAISCSLALSAVLQAVVNRKSK